MSETSQNGAAEEVEALSELEIESIEYFVSFVQLLGLPKSVGQIYGVLFVSPRAMALDDIVERLAISKGSASQGLNVLRNLGAITPVFIRGDRRDHYEPDFNLTRIVSNFYAEKLRPRFEHGTERLDRMQEMAAEEDNEDTSLRIKALRKWQVRGGSALKMILKFLGDK